MSRTRYFYRRETSPSGVERVFTVAYTHNRNSGETTYGASVFRQDSPSESFVKRDHRQTAEARLEKRPVRITVRAEHPSLVEDKIRESIRVRGVRGERQ